MKQRWNIILTFALVVFLLSCNQKSKTDTSMQKQKNVTAKDILGNPDYLAISYGGYRHIDNNMEPTLDELKEDMKILSAMGIKILRTYKVNKPHASNVLKAISELKKENPDFEMYVMLGIWINCKNAFSELPPNHYEESEANQVEVETAVALANQYPGIVKVLAVGNEAMVKWATSYYVLPEVILKWVNHLQTLKKMGKLSKDLWITSSDNFASWGGGDKEYHVEDLNQLIKAVDYISMHTYPMHDTHYNPQFWGVSDKERDLLNLEKVNRALERSVDYAKAQYKSVKKYITSIGVHKPIHIGETGWASYSNGYYGNDGSRATDEYKQALFYNLMRDWTNKNGISCFYFEAFDEPWKDAANQGGSENHFGLFTVSGKAKFVAWDLVDKGIFKGLTRGGKSITKTYNGNKDKLLKEVLLPSVKDSLVVGF